MSLQRTPVLWEKSGSISYTPCCPERVAVVAEKVAIAIGISMKSEMGMIAVPEIEEWQEYLEPGLVLYERSIERQSIGALEAALVD